MGDGKNEGQSGRMSAGVKAAIVIVVAAAVSVLVWMKDKRTEAPAAPAEKAATAPAGKPPEAGLPRLVDLGAGKCIPCKMMAPILEELKKEYSGKFEVEFIDVWEDAGAGMKYGIRVIPTQIFYDGKGKELFRHEGFFSKEDILAKWKELGVDVGSGGTTALPEEVVREAAIAVDDRPQDMICAMCEGTVESKTRVVVTSKGGGSKNFCSVHCYFIFESCLLDKSSMAEVKVTDWAAGGLVALDAAFYLYGVDERGRPTIRAFGDRESAVAEGRASGGDVIGIEALRQKEYAVRCGFCDRVMYVQDNGSAVKVIGGPQTYGCCPHCALGVATRLQKDIIVEYRDPVSGKMIRIETVNGGIKSIEPATAVAWFGQKRKPDGSWG
jgi:thioredoxin 1